MPTTYWEMSEEKKLDYLLNETFPGWVKWISSWVEMSETNGLNIKVLFTNFNELVDDETRLFERILEFFDIPLDRADFSTNAPGADAHYRRGLKEEWRSVFNEDQKKRTWQIMEGRLANMFSWKS
jgi:hypothetical protein